MIEPRSRTVFLAGAGSDVPDLDVFRIDPEAAGVESIPYPGWRRYIADDFTPERLIEELADQIAANVPTGPIRIVGMSIGGHFGYAVALRLQSRGRQIGGLCAIDSFLISSPALVSGWRGRALVQIWFLLRKRRIKSLIGFLRAKLWRTVVRAAGDGLPNLLRRYAMRWPLRTLVDGDPVLAGELSMRMLLRQTSPWLVLLDRAPVALTAPTILLRTHASQTADAAWRVRAPNIRIYTVPGGHATLFEPENIGALRQCFNDGAREWQ